MRTTGLDSKPSDGESNDVEIPDVRSRFYPHMGANISIQAIIEGSLLSKIELDPAPEYGIHF